MSTHTSIRIGEINAHHWQPALQPVTSGGASDDIAVGLHDIDQSIRIILRTPPGTDPHRPDFACNVWRYLDYPVDRAIPHVVREIYTALERWEPRIKVERIEPRVDVAQLVLRIVWRLADGIRSQVSEQATEVAYARAA